jgi:hypothetical protein
MTGPRSALVCSRFDACALARLNAAVNVGGWLARDARAGVVMSSKQVLPFRLQLGSGAPGILLL